MMLSLTKESEQDRCYLSMHNAGSILEMNGKLLPCSIIFWFGQVVL